MHIVVVANGELLYPTRLMAIINRADRVIAADGGANWLMAQHRPPDVLLGDMDSVSPQVLEALQEKGCRLQRHSPDKDETDAELALREAAAMAAERITFLGALGGRIDHTLANILLLAMPELYGIDASIYDGRSWLSIVSGDGTISGQVGDTVSLIPFGGDAEGIVTTGLKYPLHNESLPLGPARGVSNVLLQPVGHISIRRGRLLVVRTPICALES